MLGVLLARLKQGKRTIPFPKEAPTLPDRFRGLPVIDEALIEKDNHYEASLRVQTTIEGGLPGALKAMMFWMDWKRTTDWYTWTLPP